MLSAVFIILPTANAKEKPWHEPVEEYNLENGVSGGKLVLSIAGDPKSFNPIVAREATTSTITSNIFESLVTIDHITLDVVPLLAKSWLRDSKGKEWVFELREDVFFNDGKQFSAEDVAFTFNKLVFNPKIPNSAADIFSVNSRPMKVKVLDRFRVKFILPSPFSPFLTILGSQPILPKHVYEQIVDAGEFNSAMSLGSDLNSIVGTGPFVLEAFAPGERIVLKRNDYYWNKDQSGQHLPYLSKIIYLVLPNPGTALLKFLEGEVDYYSLVGEDLAYLGPLQKKRDFTVYNTGPSFASNFVILNQNKRKNPETGKLLVKEYKQKWFQDKRFRKAISFAIDREKMIDIVFNGLGSAQYGPLTPVVKNFYYDGVVKYKRNIYKARELLHSMGFEDRDADGFLEDSQDRKLDVDFYTNANSPQRVLMASMIRKDLNDIGFKINFVPLEFNNLVTRLTSNFDWEMMFIGFSGGSIDPQLSKNVWHSTAGLHAWSPVQKKPATRWEKKIDRIFNKAEKEFDYQKRKKMYDKWQKIASDELPLIYTVVPNTLYAVRNRFGNVYPSVYGGAFGKIENVFVKPDKKK